MYKNILTNIHGKIIKNNTNSNLKNPTVSINQNETITILLNSKQIKKKKMSLQINIPKNETLAKIKNNSSYIFEKSILLTNSNTLNKEDNKYHFRQNSINYNQKEKPSLLKDFTKLNKNPNERQILSRTSKNSYQNSNNISPNNSFTAMDGNCTDLNRLHLKKDNSIADKLTEKFSQVNEKIKLMKEKIKLKTAIYKLETQNNKDNRELANSIKFSNYVLTEEQKILNMNFNSKNITRKNSLEKFKSLNEGRNINQYVSNTGSRILTLNSEAEDEIKIYLSISSVKEDLIENIQNIKEIEDKKNVEENTNTDIPSLLKTIDILKNYITIQQTVNNKLKDRAQLLSKTILNIFYNAKSFDDKMKTYENQTYKFLTQILEENKYLRNICEKEVSNSYSFQPVVDILKKYLDINKEKNHKRNATAIFDDTVCFKIDLKESSNEKALLKFDNSKIDDYLELPSKDNNNDNLKSSMLKKLSKFKSKPKLFLFHSNNNINSTSNNLS